MKVVISCHFDLVPWLKGRQSWTVKDGKVTGTLDNLGGSAIVFSLLKDLEDFGVEVHFTQGEESTLEGAKELITKHRGNDVVMLVVDTANVRKGNKKADVLVACARKLSLTTKEIAKRVSARTGFSVESEELNFLDGDQEDETWAYARAGMSTVGVYLVCEGDFHSPEAFTTPRRIEATRAAVMAVVGLIREGEVCPKK